MNFSKHVSKHKTIMLLICFIISISMHAQESKSTDLGVFSFDLEEIDYGTINQHDNGNRTFTFTNRGRAPIIIADVKTTCGCTVPTFTKKPIIPGETGEISISYATNRLGVFSKSVTIISNASEQNKKIKIKGKVIAKAETK